jgi:hypothetical protein
MGNFISKEDLLLEIGTFFTKMKNGNLSLDELELLTEHTKELYERAVILKYKAMEEKVFGVIEKPVVTVPEIEAEPEVTFVEPESLPIIAEDLAPIQPQIEDEPVVDTPSFAFSLFDYDDEPVSDEAEEAPIAFTPEEEISVELVQTPVYEEPVIEIEETSTFESQVIEEVIEETPIFDSRIVEEEISTPHFEETFEPQVEVESNAISDTPSYFEQIKEEEVEELEEEIGQTSAFSYGDLAPFIHKFNLVQSNVSNQFGLVKIETLLGSFGLNERLQFINELFDGSSEHFSDAVKILDNQGNLETAKTKIAEIGLINQWDIDSETIEEFMQKVVRRYA